MIPATTTWPFPEPEREREEKMPSCEACREALLRGEAAHCSCLRIPPYTAEVRA